MNKKIQSGSSTISKASLSVKAVSASDKPRDPSTHPWRYKGNVKGGIFEIKPIPFDPKVDVPHGVCFNCWDYGHPRQKCPEPTRLDHCHNCGRIGVKVKTCPRCSESYWKYWQGGEFEHPQLKSIKHDLAKARKMQKWNETDDKVHTLHFKDVEPIRFNVELDIPCKACHNCWKPRHVGLCENPRSHDHCFNCGRIGVQMHTCPRCSKAYPKYYQKKVRDGIEESVPVVSTSSSKPKEPETAKVPVKPSVLKTISPAVTTFRSFSAVVKDQDDGYCSQNGSVSNEESSLKVNNPMFKFTRDYVKDFTSLMGTVKHLSISNQNTIVLQFIKDRNTFIEQIRFQQKNV